MEGGGSDPADTIFSQDVKDFSMYIIDSSDDDTEDEDAEVSEPPVGLPSSISHRGKDTKARVNKRTASVAKEREGLKIIDYSTLYDEVNGTSAIITEIDKFFEQSVDSLFKKEETKAEETQKVKAEEEVKVIEEKAYGKDAPNYSAATGITETKPQGSAEGAAPDGSSDPSRISIRSRRHKNPRYFGDAYSHFQYSDEDYDTDDQEKEPLNATKKKRKRSKPSAKTTTKKDIIKKQLENFGYFEEVDEGLYETQLELTNRRGRSDKTRSWKKTLEASNIDVADVSQSGTGGGRRKLKGARSGSVSLGSDDPDGIQGDASVEEKETICLKFVILDENGCVIKDDRLKAVHVNRKETLGNLANKFGELYNLDEAKFKHIAVYIDGDQQPHDATIDDEMLGIEEGMQIDVKFPPKVTQSFGNIYTVSQAYDQKPVTHGHYDSNYTCQTDMAQESSSDCEIIEID